MKPLTHPLPALLLAGVLLASHLAKAAEAPSASVSATASSATNNSSANSSSNTNSVSSVPTGTSAAGTSAAGTSAVAASTHLGPNLGTAPPSSGISNVLQVISALILVVLIMLSLAWGIKSFGPKRLLGRVPVHVVGGANLGGRERVLVIEVQDQWIVIGATPNSITTLATLPRQPLNDEELQPGKPFSDWLKQIMEKRNG